MRIALPMRKFLGSIPGALFEQQRSPHSPPKSAGLIPVTEMIYLLSPKDFQKSMKEIPGEMFEGFGTEKGPKGGD